MNISVRPYKESDYDMICEWWKAYEMAPPMRGMMIEDGTFVAELDGNPLMTITAFKTQSLEVSYLEGFCSKPGLINSIRNFASQSIVEHAYAYLRKLGFKRVNCLSLQDKLTKRYQELGGIVQCSGITSLGKELICLGQQ